MRGTPPLEVHQWGQTLGALAIWSRTAAAAIGYKEFGAPLRGTDEAVSSFRPVSGRSVRDEIFYRTCQFAKRQDTWFRHQSTPLYVPCGATAEETAAAVRAVWQAHGPWTIDLPSPDAGSGGRHGTGGDALIR